MRWLKVKSSQSSHHEGSSGNSLQSVLRGEVDGGKDFAERSKNHCVTEVLGSALLPFSERNTFLIRIEGIINPWTAVSDDCRDPLPITPAHLAIGRPINQ